MSALPIEKPLFPNERDFTDNVGQGPAHKQPPTKRMKCSEDSSGDYDEKENCEEKQEKVQKESHADPDPASVDIFANSQGGSASGYKTASEELEEGEIVDEDEDEMEKTLQMSSPAAMRDNTSDDMELKSRESLGDTMDLFASPKADKSTRKRPAGDIKHLQLGSSLEKRLQSSGKKEKLMEKSAEVKSPVQLPKITSIFNQSGPLVQEMVADAQHTDEECRHSKHIRETFEQWFKNKKEFLPDFRQRGYDRSRNFVYCEIPGHKGVVPSATPDPVDQPSITEEHVRVFTTNGRLMRQPWHQHEASGFRNMDYLQRTVDMEYYLEKYKQFGYQGFVSFLERMWGDGDEEMPMPALKKYFDDEYGRIGEDAIYERFSDIVWWASQAEKLVPKTVYRLVGNVESATFSQQQCAAILAWMMIMPEGKTFKNIFCGEDPVHVEKLKFLFNYFHVARSLPEGGTISFRRNRLCAKNGFAWAYENYGKFEVKVMQNDMKIENAAFATQVDFANRSIGGGVLNRGFEQEEIRFMMCPEMMISLLLCDDLRYGESVSIVGAQVFNSYRGIGRTTKWKDLTTNDSWQNSVTKRDHYGRLRVETIAIDAKDFSQLNDLKSIQDQLKNKYVRREYIKALSGFMTQGERFPLPIVTGWWGCGAFRGNKPLKVLIQACAAARAGRPLWICTYGDEEMGRLSKKIIKKLNKNEVCAGLLMKNLVKMDWVKKASDTVVFDQLSARVKNGKIFRPK